RDRAGRRGDGLDRRRCVVVRGQAGAIAEGIDRRDLLARVALAVEPRPEQVEEILARGAHFEPPKRRAIQSATASGSSARRAMMRSRRRGTASQAIRPIVKAIDCAMNGSGAKIASTARPAYQLT